MTTQDQLFYTACQLVECRHFNKSRLNATTWTLLRELGIAARLPTKRGCRGGRKQQQQRISTVIGHRTITKRTNETHTSSTTATVLANAATTSAPARTTTTTIAATTAVSLWLTKGKRLRGGQRLRYKDVVKRHLKATHITVHNWETIIKDRQQRRQAIQKGKSHIEENISQQYQHDHNLRHGFHLRCRLRKRL